MNPEGRALMVEAGAPAPPIQAERWFNTDTDLSLEALRGKVVVLHAFQMLCPGCVSHAVPQARRLHEIARSIDALAIVGIHTVFEHHAAMTPVSLEAFLHEYKIAFPVAVDKAAADGGPIPQTMAAYGFQGTPSTVVIDREGRIVRSSFGADDDLVLGLFVGNALGR